MPIIPIFLSGSALSQTTGLPHIIVYTTAGEAAVWDPVLTGILDGLEQLVANVGESDDKDELEDQFQAWTHTYCLVAEYRYLPVNSIKH